MGDKVVEDESEGIKQQHSKIEKKTNIVDNRYLLNIGRNLAPLGI